MTLNGREASLERVYVSRHLEHTRLTSRWDTMATTEEQIKNGSTPILIIRVMDPAAVVVCKELTTRWPVTA